MTRVLTAIVLIPLVLLLLFKAPLWLLALVVVLLALAATTEYLNIAQASGAAPFRQLTFLVMVVFFLGTAGRTLINARWMQLAQNSVGRVAMEQHRVLVHAGQTAVVLWLFLLTSPAWFLLRGMARDDLRGSLSGAGVSAFSIFYIGLPLLAFFEMRAVVNGPALLLYMLVVVWCGDIAAYYIGSAIGKHKLAPRISPGKTWEGAIASLIFSALVGTLILVFAAKYESILAAGHLASPHSIFESVAPTKWWVALLCSAGLNIAAQFGDLVESMLKRGAGMKDSGALLPGHGGVLDRIDALLFATPLLWYYSIFHILSL